MRFGEKEPKSSFCFMKLDLLLPFKSLFFVLTLVIINIRMIGYGNLPECTPFFPSPHTFTGLYSI